MERGEISGLNYSEFNDEGDDTHFSQEPLGLETLLEEITTAVNENTEQNVLAKIQHSFNRSLITEDDIQTIYNALKPRQKEMKDLMKLNFNFLES